MPFLPIASYAGFEHILSAGSLWFHSNGNAYCSVCEKRSALEQDLAIYRMRSGTNNWELVKRYRGTVDSEAQFAPGGAAAIGPSGNMIVVTSLIIPGAPHITGSGFQGCWIREMNIDAPNRVPDVSAIERRLTSIEQRIVGIETELGNLSYEGVSATDREILDRLKTLLRL